MIAVYKVKTIRDSYVRTYYLQSSVNLTEFLRGAGVNLENNKFEENFSELVRGFKSHLVVHNDKKTLMEITKIVVSDELKESYRLGREVR